MRDVPVVTRMSDLRSRIRHGWDERIDRTSTLNEVSLDHQQIQTNTCADSFFLPKHGDELMARLTSLILIAFLCTTTLTADAASPSGRWRGSWSSLSTGHRGPLRAHVRQTDADTYRAVFVGRFAGVVPFVYPAKLERVPGSCHCYTSSQRLPLLGEYRMTASVSEHRFHAKFQGRDDSGTFDLSR